MVAKFRDGLDHFIPCLPPHTSNLNLECLQNFYYLGVRKSIQKMFAIRDFRRAKRLSKPYDRVGSWWNPWHALWVNTVTGGQADTNEDMMEGGEMLGEAFTEDNAVYSLHFDWVQAKRMGKEPYSVGMVTLRCDSVDEALLNRDEWAMPLMIIPGPREPSSMDICWKIIADDFAKCELGIPIQYREEGDILTFSHRPFLVRVCCDACARHKIMKDMTASGVHPCPWCKMESSIENRSTVLGYCKAAPCKIYDWNALLTSAHPDIDREAVIEEKLIKKETDPLSYRITLEEHEKRSAILEAMSTLQLSNAHKAKIKRILGIIGKCHIAWSLKTLHPLHFVYLPVYHNLVLGLVKDFLKHIFRPDIKKVSQHDVIKPVTGCMGRFQKARSRIILNCGIDEKCIDLQACSGLLVSNTLAFVETLSCYIFNEKVCGFRMLSDKALEAWSILRKAVLYFVRDDDSVQDSHTWRCLRNEARGNLLAYAKICEEYMPNLCVQNLHIAICRLFEQEELCGRPNLCHDMFMERAIRRLKKIGYRNNHEESFVYRVLLQEGRFWLQLNYDTPSSTLDEQCNVLLEQPGL
jgi:hypothetical protein